MSLGGVRTFPPFGVSGCAGAASGLDSRHCLWTHVPCPGWGGRVWSVVTLDGRVPGEH